MTLVSDLRQRAPSRRGRGRPDSLQRDPISDAVMDRVAVVPVTGKLPSESQQSNALPRLSQFGISEAPLSACGGQAFAGTDVGRRYYAYAAGIAAKVTIRPMNTESSKRYPGAATGPRCTRASTKHRRLAAVHASSHTNRQRLLSATDGKLVGRAQMAGDC